MIKNFLLAKLKNMVRADVFLRVLLRFWAVRLRREPDNFKFLNDLSINHSSKFFNKNDWKIYCFGGNSIIACNFLSWCPGWELNPQVREDTRFWVVRVCQFRHSGIKDLRDFNALILPFFASIFNHPRILLYYILHLQYFHQLIRTRRSHAKNFNFVIGYINYGGRVRFRQIAGV